MIYNADNSLTSYMREIKKYKPLGKEEEKKLIIQAQNKDIEARDKIITSNLKFVFSIAKQYNGYGIDFSDLISEGNIGLEKAISKFDTKMDVKFLSYAVWWIKDSISKYVMSIKDKYLNEQTYGEEEYDLDDVCDDFSMKIFKIEGEDDDVANAKEICDTIKELMTCLNKSERLVIEKTYGLNGEYEHKCEEISKEMKLSNERIRQIRKKSILKLKAEYLRKN